MKDGPNVRELCLQIPAVVSLNLLVFVGVRAVVSKEDFLGFFFENSWSTDNLSIYLIIS